MTDPFRTPAQAIWLEGISRASLESGDLARVVASGKVCGGLIDLETDIQSAQHGQEHMAGLRPMAQAGWAAERALDALRVEEARAAADVFLPLFERTNGREGYVSVPATPATSAEAWLAEARRFWGAINRPNVMLHAPATPDLLAESTSAGSTLSNGMPMSSRPTRAGLRRDWPGAKRWTTSPRSPRSISPGSTCGSRQGCRSWHGTGVQRGNGPPTSQGESRWPWAC
jgi:hypothetical protein